jgi:hypothetical protein|nr:MAG TPA_asm: hypothetical protein [Caudoviricetes sp.]
MIVYFSRLIVSGSDGNIQLPKRGAKNMERYTYEITFTRLDGQPDEIQQHTSEELARECFRLFDEPDSAEMYSRIELSRHDWETATDEILETMTF